MAAISDGNINDFDRFIFKTEQIYDIIHLNSFRVIIGKNMITKGKAGSNEKASCLFL